MRSLKDATLKNGHFFLDLVDSLRPGIVDQNLVEPGRDDDECKLNGELSYSLFTLDFSLELVESSGRESPLF